MIRNPGEVFNPFRTNVGAREMPYGVRRQSEAATALLE
jgi:hypothetical protein